MTQAVAIGQVLHFVNASTLTGAVYADVSEQTRITMLWEQYEALGRPRSLEMELRPIKEK